MEVIARIYNDFPTKFGLSSVRLESIERDALRDLLEECRKESSGEWSRTALEEDQDTFSDGYPQGSVRLKPRKCPPLISRCLCPVPQTSSV